MVKVAQQTALTAVCIAREEANTTAKGNGAKLFRKQFWQSRGDAQFLLEPNRQTVRQGRTLLYLLDTHTHRLNVAHSVLYKVFSHTRTHRHAHTHTNMHTHTDTYTHTQITHIHIQTHT